MFDALGQKTWLTLGLKNVTLALEAAKAKQESLLAAEIVRETMLEAVEQGLGSQDWSALAKVTRRRAGVEETEAWREDHRRLPKLTVKIQRDARNTSVP